MGKAAFQPSRPLLSIIKADQKVFYPLEVDLHVNPTQKQPNCKKRCGPCKKGSMKKVVKSKVVAQKWLWWSDNGKFF